MSSARGQANHALYLARILLSAWRRDLSAESVASVTLTQAYMPAIRRHLGRAYGWFLIEVTRPGGLPADPPLCVAEIPEVVAGKAVPGELMEFQQLEQTGWIGDMLADDVVQVASASSGNLALNANTPGPDLAEAWADQMQSLFDRMGDSLDEY